jgi:hypothetical protein
MTLLSSVCVVPLSCFFFFFGLWVYGLKVVLGWFAKNEDGDDVLYFVVLLLLLFGFDLVLIMVK